MARLIVKSPYIKCGGGRSAGGYMRYIATRERVELIQDDRPPTRKQEQLTLLPSMLWGSCCSLMMPASMIPKLAFSGWSTPPTTETTMHPTVWARNI